MQYDVLVDAILNSNLHTIPVQEDPFSGGLFIIVNNRMLYCSPNWEGQLDKVCFEGPTANDDYVHWTVDASFTDSVQDNVLIWACIVHNEIIKLTNLPQE
jgi:hypothetical protein